MRSDASWAGEGGGTIARTKARTRTTNSLLIKFRRNHEILLRCYTPNGPTTVTNKFKLYYDFTRGRSDVLPSFLLQVKISKAKKNSDLLLSGGRLFTELQSHLCLVNSWIVDTICQSKMKVNPKQVQMHNITSQKEKPMCEET